ncbi:MAG: flagellar basal body-associated protein FliL [Methylophilaceae bacterium]|nr:flagellar basal body-associated protein FliL [Methyloradius sp.]
MAQDAEQKESKPKKSSKKLIVIILILLIIAGGGGAAAWYFLTQQHKPDEHKPVEAKVEAPKPPVFLTLETFTVNLQPDPETQYLQTDITLKVGSAEAGEFLKLHMPEVRNRLLLLLSSKKASDLLTLEGKKALSTEIIEQLKEPFNAGEKPQEVLGVSFTSFVVQ